MDNLTDENLTELEQGYKQDGWHKILFKSGDAFMTIYASPEGTSVLEQSNNPDIIICW